MPGNVPWLQGNFLRGCSSRWLISDASHEAFTKTTLSSHWGMHVAFLRCFFMVFFFIVLACWNGFLCWLASVEAQLFCAFLFYAKKDTFLGVFLICLATSYSHRGKPPTTIGAKELNDRVRHGNGCDLFAIATRHFFTSDKRQAFLSVSSFLFSHVREYAPSSPSSLPQIPCFSL